MVRRLSHLSAIATPLFAFAALLANGRSAEIRSAIKSWVDAKIPAGGASDPLDDIAERAGVDWMFLEWLAIVGELLDAEVRQRHAPRRTTEVEPHVARICALRVGNLVHERADRKALEDVVDGPQPADARMRRRLADLSGHVWHGEREIEDTLLQILEPWRRRAAERCRHATTRPFGSRPAGIRFVLTAFT